MRTINFSRPTFRTLKEGLLLKAVDVAVYSFIFTMGVYALTHYPHTADFMNDATYPDLARSILEHGSYQIRFLPQTTFPPAFSLILVAVGRFFGISPATMFPVVAIS